MHYFIESALRSLERQYRICEKKVCRNVVGGTMTTACRTGTPRPTAQKQFVRCKRWLNKISSAGR